VSHMHLLEPAAPVQEPSRVLWRSGERDSRMPRAGGVGERLAQERLAVAHPSMCVLELGLKRDAQLQREGIDRRQPRARGSTRNQRAPASTPSTTATTPQSVSRPQRST
jgi:hypothetical protein